MLVNTGSFYDQHNSKEVFTWLYNKPPIELAKLSMPETSRGQRKRLPPCPLVVALVPLNAPVEISNFLRVSYEGDMPWCPCPFNSKTMCFFDSIQISAPAETNVENKYNILNDGTLMIQNASGDDEGEYECKARNAVGETKSEPVSLRYFGAPSKWFLRIFLDFRIFLKCTY